MSNRDLFHGFSLQSVDDKGRVAIPADLRAVLDKNAEARQVLIGRHQVQRCLLGYDAEWAKLLNDEGNELARSARAEGREFDEAAWRRANRVEKSSYDSAGRFVLPAFERDKAGIGKWAFFAGEGDQFQIWAPEILLAADINDTDLKERCAFYLAQKKVAL